MLPERIRVISICVIRKGERWLVFDGCDAATWQPFYRPLGGEVHPGEQSRDAVIREFREEIGLEVSELSLRGVLENRFEFDGRPHHEIVFVYEGRFADETAYEREEFQAQEDSGETFRVAWRPLSDFTPETPLVPAGILTLCETARRTPLPAPVQSRYTCSQPDVLLDR